MMIIIMLINYDIPNNIEIKSKIRTIKKTSTITLKTDKKKKNDKEIANTQRSHQLYHQNYNNNKNHKVSVFYSSYNSRILTHIPLKTRKMIAGKTPTSLSQEVSLKQFKNKKEKIHAFVWGGNGNVVVRYEY